MESKQILTPDEPADLQDRGDWRGKLVYKWIGIFLEGLPIFTDTVRFYI